MLVNNLPYYTIKLTRWEVLWFWVVGEACSPSTASTNKYNSYTLTLSRAKSQKIFGSVYWWTGLSEKIVLLPTASQVIWNSIHCFEFQRIQIRIGTTWIRCKAFNLGEICGNFQQKRTMPSENGRQITTVLVEKRLFRSRTWFSENVDSQKLIN